MESSRGGPLSTFIMMLPLIVVPTVAMLKPAGNPVGMVTDMLSASDEEQADSSAFAEADELTAENFDDFFGDETGSSTDALQDPIGAKPNRDLEEEAMTGFAPDFSDSPGGNDFPFADDGAPFFDEPPPQRRTPSTQENAQVQRGVALVKKAGATEVMWVEPTPGSHVFIAFFHNTTSGKILRFEAVAPTKTQAIADVMNQIRQRRQQ